MKSLALDGHTQKPLLTAPLPRRQRRSEPAETPEKTVSPTSPIMEEWTPNSLPAHPAPRFAGGAALPLTGPAPGGGAAGNEARVR